MLNCSLHSGGAHRAEFLMAPPPLPCPETFLPVISQTSTTCGHHLDSLPGISWLLPYSFLKMVSLSPRTSPRLGFLTSHPGSILAFRKPPLPSTYLVRDVTVNISTSQVQVQFDYFGPDQTAGTPNPFVIFQREEDNFSQGGQGGWVHESWWQHVG